MKYAIKDLKENMAATHLRGLPISLKDSLIISKFIKGKNVQKVKTYLEEVVALKRAIPYTKYNGDRGHKRGNMAAGRYPVKAAKNFLTLIKSAESNAVAKGLNADKLIISAIIPNKGNVGYHYGRRRGLKTKSVHIQLYLEESAKAETKTVTKKKAPAKKEEKVEEKKEATEKPKAEVKEEKKDEPKTPAKKKEIAEETKEEEVKND